MVSCWVWLYEHKASMGIRNKAIPSSTAISTRISTAAHLLIFPSSSSPSSSSYSSTALVRLILHRQSQKKTATPAAPHMDPSSSRREDNDVRIPIDLCRLNYRASIHFCTSNINNNKYNSSNSTNTNTNRNNSNVILAWRLALGSAPSPTDPATPEIKVQPHEPTD